MAKLILAYFVAISCGVLCGASDENYLRTRQPRHLKQRLCGLLGLCGGGLGNQGYGGYQGYNQPYNQGYPPINIGVSQSQTSAAGGGGFYGGNYPSYPNNYQYNGNFGYPGFNPHNGGYHNGPPNGGYSNGYNPGYFGNGYGSSNNQFNGNYYGPRPGPGPFGGFFDEETSEPVKPIREENQEDNYDRSSKNKDK